MGLYRELLQGPPTDAEIKYRDRLVDFAVERDFVDVLNEIDPKELLMSDGKVTAADIMSTEFPRMKHIEELEGKCHALWLLNGGQTEKWNGQGCDCEYIQGNLNCKLNPF